MPLTHIQLTIKHNLISTVKMLARYRMSFQKIINSAVTFIVQKS